MPTQEILALDKDEQILVDVRRHPIGLIFIYGSTILISVGLLVLLFIVVSQSNQLFNISDEAYGLMAGLLIALTGLFGYIASRIYKSNQLVVTDESIIQVLQFSLLNRQVSQLNIAKVQDVSVDETGLLQTFIGYGTIEIETAGEASNFRFPYAYDANRIAKIIIEAHEDYVQKHPSDSNYI